MTRRSSLARLALFCHALCVILPATGAGAGDSSARAAPGRQLETEPGGGTAQSAPPEALGEEEGEQKDPSVWYERIVVTATRTDRSAKDVPFHATVVGRSELETAPEYGMLDILRRVPSLHLQGDETLLTAAPIDGGIAFRGLGGTARGRGLVLVDGMPVNDPFGTNVLWSRVPRDAIERVEVLPGGTSIWGNLSLSGVVSLITRSAEESLYGARARIGNRSTREATLSYSDLGEGWSGWVSGNYLETDGYHLLAADHRGPIDEPTAKDFGILTGRLSRAFSTDSDLHLGITLFDEDYRAGSALSRRYYSELAVTSNYERIDGRGSLWELRAYGRDNESEELDPATDRNRTAETPGSRTAVPTEALGLGGVWHSQGAGKHALSAGMDVQLISIDATEDDDFTSGSYTTRAFIQGEQQLAGIFVQDVFTPSPRTALTLGGRFDAIRTRDGYRREVDFSTGAVAERVLVDRNTEATFNPSLGFVHELSRHARLRGAAYSGFRAGAPAELFVDNLGRNVTLSNPTVSPERLIGAEVGLDLTFSRRLSTRATLFRTEASDLIDRVLIGRAGPGGEVIEPCGFLSAGATCRLRDNLGRVRSNGIELEQEVRFNDRWRVHLAGTLMDAEVTSSPQTPELVGNRVLRVPEEAAVLSLRYDNSSLFHAELRGRFMGDRFNDVENDQPIPSQLTVDLSLTRSLGPRWRLQAGATNLFDREIVAGYDGSIPELSPPRLMHLGFSFASR